MRSVLVPSAAQDELMKNVLVVQLARMGDLLQSKRLILSVLAEKDTIAHLLVDNSLGAFAGQLYPHCVVHTLAASASLDDARAALSDAQSTGRLLGCIQRDLQALMAEQFDEVYFLNSSPLSYILARLFDPAICRGLWVKAGQPGQSLWSRLAKRFTEHRPSSPLNLVDYWGQFHPNPVVPSAVNPVARQAGHKRIGVVIAGQQARRSLPAEILARCLQAVFQAKNGPTFVLLGTKNEQRATRALIRLLPSAVLKRLDNMVGKTDLQNLPEVFAGLDGLLTPDTGLMHLAAHCGVPVQAFFLSSAWCHETGPYGLGHKVWQSVFPCSPCLETTSCPHHVRCLNPFGDNYFVTHLSGKFDGGWPGGLCGYVSNFDDLGATCVMVDGEDPHALLRAQKRSVIKEFVQRRMLSLPAGAGDLVFCEHDWLLPERY